MRRTGNFARLEMLESRLLMAAGPLTIAQIAINGGTQLRVTGTAKNDAIVITLVAGGLKIANADWSRIVTGTFKSVWVDAADGNDAITLDPALLIDATLQGGNGNDTLAGGAGNDRLLGGAGKNKFAGGAGNDTLISLGIGAASTDTLAGGAGFDSFWADSAKTESIVDASAAEIAEGAVHRVGSFFSVASGKAVSKALKSSVKAQKLADPTTTDNAIVYKNFSDHPLFADSGPSIDDVQQGYLGDCYFLASLASMAKVDADAIRQSVVDLGDGTYAVQFTRKGAKVFVRVDGDLPTWGGNALAYANFGAQGSIWAAVMEKAYAFFRRSKGTYSSLEGGWMQDVYRDLGLKARSFWQASSGTTLLTLIQKELNSDRFVTYAVGAVPAGAPVIGNHAYTVDRVIADDQGKPIGLVLRNPWAIDGTGDNYAGIDGQNDGYVTLTADQTMKTFMGISSANT